jgi:hypothetical protein
LADAGRSIDPTWLNATLFEKRQLPAKEEILPFHRCRWPELKAQKPCSFSEGLDSSFDQGDPVVIMP